MLKFLAPMVFDGGMVTGLSIQLFALLFAQ